MLWILRKLSSVLFFVGGLSAAFCGVVLVFMSASLFLFSELSWSDKYLEFLKKDSDYAMLREGLAFGLITLGCYYVVELFIKALQDRSSSAK